MPYRDGGETNQPAWWWLDITYCEMLQEKHDLPLMIEDFERRHANAAGGY